MHELHFGWQAVLCSRNRSPKVDLAFPELAIYAPNSFPSAKLPSKLPERWLTEKIRRDCGDGLRGRPASSTKNARRQTVELREIQPSNERDTPTGETNDSIGYDVGLESQARMPAGEGAPGVTNGDHSLPADAMNYSGDPDPLLQTPPDSMKEDRDDFLFEPHAICLWSSIRFLQIIVY
jgi:hypothetical protein